MRKVTELLDELGAEPKRVEPLFIQEVQKKADEMKRWAAEVEKEKELTRRSERAKERAKKRKNPDD